MKITVYHTNNRFFLPITDGVREIPFAMVQIWQEEGTEIEIREVEQYV